MEDHERHLERLLEMRTQRFVAEQRRKQRLPISLRLKWRSLLSELNMGYRLGDWFKLAAGPTSASINAEIAAIPQPLVRVARYNREEVPSLDCKVLLCAHAFRTRKSEASLYVTATLDSGRKAVDALSQIFSQATAADKGTKIDVRAAADGNVPYRSSIVCDEQQNYRMPREEPVDGRHFDIRLRLSKPLHERFFQELHDPNIEIGMGVMLPSVLLCIPLDRYFPARPLAIGATEPMERVPKQRLRQLLLVGYTGELGEGQVTRVTVFEESD